VARIVTQLLHARKACALHATRQHRSRHRRRRWRRQQ
jgi:hypothetical protein